MYVCGRSLVGLSMMPTPGIRCLHPTRQKPIHTNCTQRCVILTSTTCTTSPSPPPPHTHPHPPTPCSLFLLQPPDMAKAVLARGVANIPTSYKLWIAAARLEADDAAKSRVLRRALERIPGSVR